GAWCNKTEMKHRCAGGDRRVSESTMTSARVLTINGGSSSIKFALFECGSSMHRVFAGKIERIGLSDARFSVTGPTADERFSSQLDVPDHQAAANAVMDWIETHIGHDALAAEGHRVVHGGPSYHQPQFITQTMLDELRRLTPFDPQHLPNEIALAEALQLRFPRLPQVACFDTAFHHDLPPVAQLLPIPRRYASKGIRRYGFHGLSYAYLMDELA